MPTGVGLAQARSLMPRMLRDVLLDQLAVPHLLSFAEQRLPLELLGSLYTQTREKGTNALFPS